MSHSIKLKPISMQWQSPLWWQKPGSWLRIHNSFPLNVLKYITGDSWSYTKPRLVSNLLSRNSNKALVVKAFKNKSNIHLSSCRFLSSPVGTSVGCVACGNQQPGRTFACWFSWCSVSVWPPQCSEYQAESPQAFLSHPLGTPSLHKVFHLYPCKSSWKKKKLVH